MKTRWGFVSNSSSSSFCIIGVEDTDLAMELAKLEGLVDDDGYISLGHGVGIGNVVCIYGGHEPYWAGIEAKPLLKKMTLPKAIKHFKKLVKDNFGFDIPLSSIDLQYGEAGDG
jgi:hypothetical protein